MEMGFKQVTQKTSNVTFSSDVEVFELKMKMELLDLEIK